MFEWCSGARSESNHHRGSLSPNLLVKDRKLRERLLGQVKVKKKKVDLNPGMHKQFAGAWANLGLPLDDKGLLDKTKLDYGECPPELSNPTNDLGIGWATMVG